jgi:hypothetical protein
MILDDGGDATMFALWGARVEAGEDLFSRQCRGTRIRPRIEAFLRRSRAT